MASHMKRHCLTITVSGTIYFCRLALHLVDPKREAHFMSQIPNRGEESLWNLLLDVHLGNQTADSRRNVGLGILIVLPLDTDK